MTRWGPPPVRQRADAARWRAAHDGHRVNGHDERGLAIRSMLYSIQSCSTLSTPTPVDEAHGWGIDDMWTYAFYALVLYGRVAAERTGRSLNDIAAALAARRGIDLEDS